MRRITRFLGRRRARLPHRRGRKLIVDGWVHHGFPVRHEGEPNEYNRFGWVVEVDPFVPDGTPKKRTALERMEHEKAVVVHGSRGEAVVYMGDDTQFDYFDKFVRAEPINKARNHRRGPLDEGTLFATRFSTTARAAGFRSCTVNRA